MSREHGEWDEAQARWFVGESLSAGAEQLRRNPPDALGVRELALLAELGQLLDRDPPASRELVERVLQATRSASSRPQLRLVTSSEPLAGREPVAEVAQLPKRSLVRAAGMGAVALLSVAAAIAVFRASPQAPVSSLETTGPGTAPPSLTRAELVFASGEVLRGDKAANVGEQMLVSGERIQTLQGHACLRLDPGIDVCLSPGTQLELGSLVENRLELRVGEGLAVASLTPRASGNTFSMTANGLTATAKGTVFAVESRGGRVSVLVAEGRVEVQAGKHRAQVVGEHSSLLSQSGNAPVRSALSRADEGMLFGLLAKRQLWQSGELAMLEIPAAAGFVEAAVDDSAAVGLPLFTFIPAGKRQLVIGGSGGGRSTLELELSPGERRRLDLSELLRGPENAAPAPTPTGLLGAARRELQRGNPKGALALYMSLRSAFPASSEAKTVLITIGKLELDHANAPARALQHFEAYLRTGGALAPEALSGKIRALRALARASDERTAIEQYLSRYPNRFDAAALRQRLQTLHVR